MQDNLFEYRLDSPYDLIIIKENVIPDKHIEELMLLTNNNEKIKRATVINRDDDGNQSSLEKLESRNTLWYTIPEEEGNKLQVAISQVWAQYIVPKYHCEFDNMNLLSSLGIQ